MSFLSGVGIVIQLLNQLVIAYYFGANAELESYYIGITIPLYIVTVLNFCINTAFIPKYIEIKSSDDEEARKFAQSVLAIVFVITSVIFGLGIVFREQILLFIFPSVSPMISTEAVHLSIYLWSSVILVPLFIVISSKMQSDASFLISALAPLLNILSMTAILIVFSKRYGIVTYAIATVAGNMIQLLILVGCNLKWMSVRIGQISKHISAWLKTMAILASGNIITRFTPVMERTASATQPLGALAELSYANRIISVISSIVTTGIATTGFTQFSELSASNEIEKFRNSLMRMIRVSILITLPIMVIMLFQIENLVRLIFMRGKFHESNVQNVGVLIKCYLVYLLFANIGSIIGRGLYAIGMIKIATLLDAFGVLYYGIILFFFTRFFGIQGVAWSFSLYYLISVSVAAYYLLKKIDYHFNKNDVHFIGQMASSMIIMILPFMWTTDFSLPYVMIKISISFGLFIAALHMLKNQDYHYFMNKLGDKFGQRLKIKNAEL